MQNKGHGLRNFLLFSAAIALLTFLYKDRERLQDRVNDLLDSPHPQPSNPPSPTAAQAQQQPKPPTPEPTEPLASPREPEAIRSSEPEIPVEEIFEPIEESIEDNALFMPPVSRGDDFGLSAPSPTSLFRSQSTDQPAEQPVTQSVERPAEQLTHQPIAQPVAQSVEQPDETPAEPEANDTGSIESAENTGTAESDANDSAEPKEPTWVRPVNGQCPEGFPIKARFATGHFHSPGDRGYEKIIPDCCYPNVESAQADGFAASRWA